MTLGWRQGRVAVALTLVTVARLSAQAVPGQLGLSEPDAQQSLLGSVIYGYPQWGAAGGAFVALPAAARVAVVEAGFAWARVYVASPAFRAAYESARQQARPQPPEFEGTVDDELRRQIAAQRADLEESRQALALLAPEQRQELETFLRQSEAQLEDPEFLAMMRTAIEGDRAGAQETYRDAMRQWEETRPADPGILVRRRLEAFLAECGDVNFSARLVPRDGRQRFANPDDEARSPNWKTCYRAGPDAMRAARAAATAWLGALPQP